MISGVVVTKLGQFNDERGSVLHMMREDDEIFRRFGEIYFSVIKSKAIKGWYQHEKMTLNFATISGAIKLVLFDERWPSPSNGEFLEIELSVTKYFLVTIPPKIWYGFKAISSESAILANCSTLPHSPEEVRKKNFDCDSIPYSWDDSLRRGS